MYGSTIIGVVGQPYPYCSLVTFYAFARLGLCAFVFLVRAKSFWKKKIQSLKTALITSFTLLLFESERKRGSIIRDRKHLKEGCNRTNLCKF